MMTIKEEKDYCKEIASSHISDDIVCLGKDHLARLLFSQREDAKMDMIYILEGEVINLRKDLRDTEANFLYELTRKLRTIVKGQ